MTLQIPYPLQPWTTLSRESESTLRAFSMTSFLREGSGEGSELWPVAERPHAGPSKAGGMIRRGNRLRDSARVASPKTPTAANPDSRNEEYF
jgi:hypothetical protein